MAASFTELRLLTSSPTQLCKKKWESTLSSTGFHCLGDLHQLMQAFNLLAFVPVEGEDSMTQLLPRCLSKWLKDMRKVEIVWLDWPGPPPPPCHWLLASLICSQFSQNSLSMVVKATKESQNDEVSCHRSKIDEIGVSL